MLESKRDVREVVSLKHLSQIRRNIKYLQVISLVSLKIVTGASFNITFKLLFVV